MMHRSDTFDYVVKTVEAFLKEEQLKGKGIAVALSGGADSVCLLRALAFLADDWKLHLFAIHINHGIRGAEADRDENFCLHLCGELGVRLEIHRVDVPSYAQEKHLSMESAARELRYKCFDMFLSRHVSTYIATAHQANDNAETILFRMARGTGLHGLTGIPRSRGRFVRPCLSLSSEEMRLALEERGYSYCVDSTNSDTAYTRNFIRQELLPKVERVHENAVQNISLMTESLTEDDAFLIAYAEKVLSEASGRSLRPVVSAQPDAIAKRILQQLYAPVKASNDAMTAVQVKSALELVRGSERHASLTLPCGIEMRIEGDDVFFAPSAEPVFLKTQMVSLGVNSFVETGDCIILSESPITKETFSELNIYKLLIQSRIYFDTMSLNLHVRAKQDGDAYRYGGMTHRVKKLYNDKKLTLEERAKRPVLCDEFGILWIPGFGVRDGMSDDTCKKKKHCIYVCYCSMTEASND